MPANALTVDDLEAASDVCERAFLDCLLVAGLSPPGRHGSGGEVGSGAGEVGQLPD